MFLAQHAVYATYSHARAFDGDEIVPSYSYPTPATGATPGTPPAFSTATSAGTGTGFRWNQALRVGYDYKPIQALAIVVEGFWHNTRHVLQAVDVARADATRHAFGGDLAMMYTF